MYIKEFHIKNFRSIKELTLSFNKGVNIIIGENNSGKTAIIDALRVCLSYGSMYRDVYVNKDRDFYLDSQDPAQDGNEIYFGLIFQPESIAERAAFVDMIRQPAAGGEQTIELHFKYFLEERNDNKYLRWRVWGGENEGQQVPVEALQLISHTYLGALRDATEKLRPHSYGNKIASLFRNLKKFTSDETDVELTKEKRQELADSLKNQVEDGEWKKVVETGNKKVKEHIMHSTINGKHPDVEFSFLPYTFNEIVDNIEARKPVYIENGTPIENQKYFTIRQNGLGENNIIYAGTVLGDLISESQNEQSEYYYNALLIEEPEAHLHPQKQNTFFEYLSSLKNSAIQVFITSHSPTITAKADLDYVKILQRRDNLISSFSLKNSELHLINKKYLSKFLDVTKSQLFFANGVILVEGISEALLLPVFSKIINENLEKHGVEIVNLNGVAFEHFAKLFNSENEEKRMLAKCTLLTDDDNGQISNRAFNSVNKSKVQKIVKVLEDYQIIDDNGKILNSDLKRADFGDGISKDFVTLILDLIQIEAAPKEVEITVDEFLKFSKELSKKQFSYLKSKGVIDNLNRIRKTDLSELEFQTELLKEHIQNVIDELYERPSSRASKALDFGGGNLKVRCAEITFEYAIMIASKFNIRIVKYIYSRMHTGTQFLPATSPIKEQAYDVLLRLYSNDDKSELAHQLAILFDEHKHLRKRFIVPNYIRQGIKWATKGEE